MVSKMYYHYNNLYNLIPMFAKIHKSDVNLDNRLGKTAFKSQLGYIR